MSDRFAVMSVAWDSAESDAARAIRMEVFVREQKVPAELELDETDKLAFHVLAVSTDGIPCGTGRLFPDPEHPEFAHIGRMAVLDSARGVGCGRAILHALLDEARRRSFARIVLSAQTHAISFYAREGFLPCGSVYLDAGIPHQTMEMDLA